MCDKMPDMTAILRDLMRNHIRSPKAGLMLDSLCYNEPLSRRGRVNGQLSAALWAAPTLCAAGRP
jgi:hypothetical protein